MFINNGYITCNCGIQQAYLCSTSRSWTPWDSLIITTGVPVFLITLKTELSEEKYRAKRKKIWKRKLVFVLQCIMYKNKKNEFWKRMVIQKDQSWPPPACDRWCTAGCHWTTAPGSWDPCITEQDLFYCWPKRIKVSIGHVFLVLPSLCIGRQCKLAPPLK